MQTEYKNPFLKIERTSYFDGDDDQTKGGERMRTPLLDWFTGFEGDLKFPEMGT